MLDKARLGGPTATLAVLLFSFVRATRVSSFGEDDSFLFMEAGFLNGAGWLDFLLSFKVSLSFPRRILLLATDSGIGFVAFKDGFGAVVECKGNLDGRWDTD